MSNHFKILTTAVRMAYSDINSTDKMVLVSLLNHYNYKTKECRPSALCIASECCASERTVHRSISKLRESGYINYIKGHTGKANEYSFVWLKLFPLGMNGLCEPNDNMALHKMVDDNDKKSFTKVDTDNVTDGDNELLPPETEEVIETIIEPTVKVTLVAKGKGKPKQKVIDDSDIVDVAQSSDGSWSSEPIESYFDGMLKESEPPF